MSEKSNKTQVAYFSMEIAVESDLKMYAGGLGVLAGDLLRSAANLNFPITGISILNRQGYLKQKISIFKNQISGSETKNNLSKLKKLNKFVEINIGKEKVKVGVWQYKIKSQSGFIVPVYFLDTDLKENSSAIRNLSGRLYGGDRAYRLKQEIVLGRGGIKMLKVLGYSNIKKIHLNEGHGSLACLELLEQSKQKTFTAKAKEVRKQVVFTTHTTIANSQEIFLLNDLLKYQQDFPEELRKMNKNNEINFTSLGFYFSSYINAVSKMHQKVVSTVYQKFEINSNTNGVDSIFWSSDEFKKMYDKYIAGWRKDNSKLKQALKISKTEIASAHKKAKKRLLDYANKFSKGRLREDVFTIGFARRFTPYKRPEFIFQDIKELLRINNEVGKIQLIYSGKAHPGDKEGQKIINSIFRNKKRLKNKIEIVFIEDYNLDKAKLLVSGVDLWLNNPIASEEASGTSGMKAAHNGIPQLSTLSGWWIEGYYENKTGWAILENLKNGKNNLYQLLSNKIIPLYYNDQGKWLEIMRTTIAFNASFFNSQRTLKQYIKEAYKIKIKD